MGPACELDKLATPYGYVANSGEVCARNWCGTTRSALPATITRSSGCVGRLSGLIRGSRITGGSQQ